MFYMSHMSYYVMSSAIIGAFLWGQKYNYIWFPQTTEFLAQYFPSDATLAITLIFIIQNYKSSGMETIWELQCILPMPI